MTNSMEEIKQYLINHNIKPSHPRIKIFEYLVKNKNHPTVDKIYSELIKEIPTLSKTTVYNTLGLFIKENVTKLITIEEGETRYDADVSNHGHFKCTNCGEIYDFRLNDNEMNVEDLDNFKVNEKNFYYLGLCEKCLTKN